MRHSLLGLLGLALLAAGCGGLEPPTYSTSVNEATFPQELPKVPELEIPEDAPPPPPLENSAYKTVNGKAQYRIGPDDALDLLISRGTTQDKLTVYVQADGTIFVLLTEVPVGGLTAPEAKAAITDALNRYFTNTRVEVRMKEFNSKKVTVVGSVGTIIRGSGASVPLTGKMNVSEAIGKAGGFNALSEMARVKVSRADGVTYTINFFRFMQEADKKQDFVLDDGDTVFVPEHVKGEEQRVFLLGEFKTPGPVPFYRGQTLLTLVGGAGGWTDNARFDQAAVIRASATKTEILTVDLRQLMIQGDRKIDQYLRPNDIVFLPRTPIANWNAVVMQLMPTFTLMNQPMSTALNIKALMSF